MIKEQDLLDAIAECQGERNPDAKTCIKLAAYYTILNNIKKSTENNNKPTEEIPSYSYAEPPMQVRYDSGSEFSEVIRGLDAEQILDVIDELMDTIMVLSPKLYNATIEKLRRK